MNKYTITITRNGDTIFDKQITADEAIDAMRPRADFREPIVVSPDTFKDMKFKVNVDVPMKDRPSKTKKVKHSKKAKAGKRVVHCKGCGEEGHIFKTCPNKGTTSDAAETPRQHKPITPDQLFKTKEMFKEGATSAEIAQVTGLEVDRVEKMKQQLGY